MRLGTALWLLKLASGCAATSHKCQYLIGGLDWPEEISELAHDPIILALPSV